MKSLRKIDTQKISEAIANFESKVNFEFVPVISTRSSYVEHIQWILSLIFLLLFVSTIDFFLYDSWANKTILFALAPFVAVLLGTLLDKSDIVDRFFISRKERNRQVHEKAVRLFYLKNLNQINSKNALLLYISLMEKQIVLLPDPQLDGEKKELLNQLSQKSLRILQQHFKARNYEVGLLETINMLTKELAGKFPRGNDSSNLVPNKLTWWDT